MRRGNEVARVAMSRGNEVAMRRGNEVAMRRGNEAEKGLQNMKSETHLKNGVAPLYCYIEIVYYILQQYKIKEYK